jgi:hypothetical protein
MNGRVIRFASRFRLPDGQDYPCFQDVENNYGSHWMNTLLQSTSGGPDESTEGLMPLPDGITPLKGKLSNRSRFSMMRWRGAWAGPRARYQQLFSGPALGKAYADLFREAA